MKQQRINDGCCCCPRRWRCQATVFAAAAVGKCDDWPLIDRLAIRALLERKLHWMMAQREQLLREQVKMQKTRAQGSQTKQRLELEQKMQRYCHCHCCSRCCSRCRSCCGSLHSWAALARTLDACARALPLELQRKLKLKSERKLELTQLRQLIKQLKED